MKSIEFALIFVLEKKIGIKNDELYFTNSLKSQNNSPVSSNDELLFSNLAKINL
jgi:hypothetical protein